jgi:hypothetical protein
MDSNPIFLGPSAIGEFYARLGEVVKARLLIRLLILGYLTLATTRLQNRHALACGHSMG